LLKREYFTFRIVQALGELLNSWNRISLVLLSDLNFGLVRVSEIGFGDEQSEGDVKKDDCSNGATLHVHVKLRSLPRRTENSISFERKKVPSVSESSSR